MAGSAAASRQRPHGLARKLRKEAGVLALFTRVYCDGHHRSRRRGKFESRGRVGEILEGVELVLCEDCAATLGHGVGKLLLCPYHPKPRCKHCPTPCYSPAHRERVRRIMRYAGKKLILRGRLDLLFKLLF